MKITVTTLGDELFTLEVSEDMELENFKALLEFESQVPASEMAILWSGRPLQDEKKKLGDYGIKDGEVLLLQRMQGGPRRGPGAGGTPASSGSGAGGMPTIDFGSIRMPGQAGTSSAPPVPMAPSASGSGGSGLPDDPETIRQMLLSSPHDLALLKERNPPLAEALLSGDAEKFRGVLQRQQQERSERERERIRLLAANPFDPEVQQKIAEEIRLKNVESNMETAMEYSPESFGQVVMLYIDCMVNGHPVKAFVDSGAQMTIMSQRCAERCNIMRLVDTRWAGIAKGVGTQKIIGRVHLGQIQIGTNFLQSSFSILEEQPMDMLLGLDMLKRHQCCIDLKRNVLMIATTGTETPFLSEGDLPEHARLNRDLPESQQDEDHALAEALATSATEAANNPGTSGAPQAAPSTQQHPFAEADIKKLSDYGFPREQVIHELQRANGNIDQALAALFAKSFQMPSSS